ncbi:MAG: adenylate/guanylate cyclase domain-containing protein [Polyangiaceae bacterium]|nr:adenylate/guanylate cyclase domain-containing protein [Polyangiaceae bacterium]
MRLLRPAEEGSSGEKEVIRSTDGELLSAQEKAYAAAMTQPPAAFHERIGREPLYSLSEEAAAQEFSQWLATYDPADADPGLLSDKFMDGISQVGIDVHRSSMWLPTAHPELWGTQIIWEKNTPVQVIKREHEVYDTKTYRGSPGEAMHQHRKPLRYSLERPDQEIEYELLRDLKKQGATDYLIVPFHTDHQFEQPWIAFSTQRPGGFSVLEINALKAYCVPLSWKARVAVAESATRNLLQVYLGQEAASRVLRGEFRRGTGSERQAVIWFCDLRGFTSLGDRLSAEELVKVLDQYFECVAGPIEEAGGEILKFIGDAVLAVFPITDTEAASASAALAAAKKALRELERWSAEHAEHPPLEIGISLHIGQVMYGNIGGRSRLDFTVIGSAVNEAARVESLCKELGSLLATGRFAEAVSGEGLRSLGKRELRGVKDAVEIFQAR